ncbi:MAG: hypothetical protein KKG35_03105 [Proteobacteria bacterium]|nr:hypothetical protein [Pseudomonadota bacterium]
MKRAFVALMTLAMVLMLTVTAGAVPNLISYQGILNDGGGNPISSTVSITFKIYDVPSGGTELWGETQSVQASNGIFNVQLGSIHPLASSVFQTDTLYLGIQVGADPEMVPRQQLMTGGYSQKAALVEETISPIGAVMAWMKSMPGVPSLPEGWVECGGQTLVDVDSPLNGQVIPDLNGQNRFLRGAVGSGLSGGATSHGHNIGHVNTQFMGAGNVANANKTDAAVYISAGYYGGGIGDFTNRSASHLPSYYEVVWIMKVK